MGPAVIGVVIAMVAGVMIGNAGQRAKRARLDYQRTKSLIEGARKLAWAESVRGLKVFAVAGAVVATLAFVVNQLAQHT